MRGAPRGVVRATRHDALHAECEKATGEWVFSKRGNPGLSSAFKQPPNLKIQEGHFCYPLLATQKQCLLGIHLTLTGR